MSEPVVAEALDGRCLCGSVTVHIAHTPDARPGLCHCRMCQRWSGAAYSGEVDHLFWSKVITAQS